MDSKNITTLRAAHNSFSASNAGSAAQVAAPDIHFVDHGRGVTVNSPGEFQSWLESRLAMSSDVRIVDQVYIAAGDWVTARFRAVGIQDGPMAPLPFGVQQQALHAGRVRGLALRARRQGCRRSQLLGWAGPANAVGAPSVTWRLRQFVAPMAMHATMEEVKR